MNNSDNSPEKSLKTDQGDRRERVYFRVVGLAPIKLGELKQRLDGIQIEAKQRKTSSDFVVSIELTSREDCEILKRVLSTFSLAAPFGLYVALLTENESDGIRLAPFLCDFWRQVGGTLDFAFTVLTPEE